MIKESYRTLHKFLSDLELKRFMNEANKTPRDALMFTIAFYAGLRTNEICKLRLEHFNPLDRTVTIHSVRGGLIKSYHLQETWKMYLNWRKVRDKKYPDSPWIFPHRTIGKGERSITKDGVLAIFSEICKKTGLKGFTPTDLRHKSALLRVKDGASIQEIMSQLRTRTAQSVEPYFRTFQIHETQEDYGVPESFKQFIKKD